jgi:hypothetical protein
VSKVEGVLVETNPAYLTEIKSMSSFLFIEIFHTPGKLVKKTIDCFTWAGLVKLFNASETGLARDYDRIRQMEDHGLFIVK